MSIVKYHESHHVTVLDMYGSLALLDPLTSLFGMIAAGPSPTNTFSVPDCRSMVKTLVCGVKTITWGAGSCKVSGSM